MHTTKIWLFVLLSALIIGCNQQDAGQNIPQTVTEEVEIDSRFSAALTNVDTETGIATISGTSQPNAIITLKLLGSAPIITAEKADEYGRWSTEYEELSPGILYELVAGTADQTDQTINFTIEGTVPLTAILEGVDENGISNNDNVFISGTIVPGARVIVLLNNIIAVPVFADSAGNWSATVNHLQPGIYSTTIQADNADSVLLNFTVQY